MFGFMKRHSDKDKDEKERKKKEKLEKEQKRNSKSLTADELIRLEEAKQALEKKSPGGGNDDAADGDSVQGVAANEGSALPPRENSQKGRTSSGKPSSRGAGPATQPKPPKKGILKDKSSYGPSLPNQGVRGNVDDTVTLEENTLANEVLSGVGAGDGDAANVKTVVSPLDNKPSLPGTAPPQRPVKKPKQMPSIARSTSKNSSPKISVAAAVVPAVVRPPSPVDKSYDDVDLQLPNVAPPLCPKSRDLVLRRQTTGDFGFTLRKGVILERGADGGSERKRTVIFAEPGPKNLSTGLLPGDRLIEVNGSNVESLTREMVIELIKATGDSVQLRVQTIPELSELSMRSGGPEGDESSADGGGEAAASGGTLKRSGSLRYQKNQSKSEDQLASEKAWLSAEKVWLVHKGGFAAARVLKAGGIPGGLEGLENLPDGKCKVKLEHGGEILDVDDDDVEKANPPQFDRVEDLSTLRYVNESCLLHTLRQRYGSNLIHSYAGQSLIVINPMHPLSIYTEKVTQMFKGCKPEDMPPHIYATAQTSYRNLLSSRRDQSIILMGRSGSGKTTNARHILQYYAMAYGSINHILTVDKLNAVFCLLDNFGNSKTILNVNASNFTQVTTVNFDNMGVIASASIQALMLEKCRIVRRPDGEPTFNVIYQFLVGLDNNQMKELHLENLSDVNSFVTPLQRPEERQRAAQTWAKIQHSFVLLKITESEVKAVCSVLASIYHLGTAGSVKGVSNRYQFQHPTSAQYAADILGTTIEELVRMIFSGGVQTSSAYRGTPEKDASCENGIGSDALEGFIVGLYLECFQAIISLINRSLSSSYHTMSSILIIDSPGFRNPASGGRNAGATFEDLCHNYIQERLQLLFHDAVFTSKLDLYSQENITCDSEPILKSPAAMVMLLDRANQGLVRPTGQDFEGSDMKGLLWLLDEEAISTGSSDATLLQSIGQMYVAAQREGLLAVGGGEPDSFVLNHFQGTIPVWYSVRGWLKACRENAVTRVVGPFLTDSKKSEISSLFTITSRSTISANVIGSVVGYEGATSLHRVSSMRRTFTSGAAGVKRRSISLQVKFQMDALMEMVRRTRPHFVHCILPQSNAGLCELKMFSSVQPPHLAASSSSDAVPLVNANDDVMLNVPLVRSQIRGAETLDAIRFYRQGYPEHMQLKEFCRRFEILSPSAVKFNDMDEKMAVEHLLDSLDVDKTTYKLGLSQVLFHAGGLARLEYAREEKVSGWVVKLQTICRTELARRNHNKLKLQHLAASCIQRNIRKLMGIREWPWWRLYTKVKPLLNVHRTEEELRDREVELDQLKQKLEKSERERNEYKQMADKLEAKLTEVLGDLQEENSTSNQASEMLERETSERIRLEKELKDLQAKHSGLQQQHHNVEMELMDARMLEAAVDSDMDDDADEADSVYRQRYEKMKRETELMRKKTQQQHEDDVEQLETTKKQLERKLAEVAAESEEQSKTIAGMKKKTLRSNQDAADIKLHLEEQLTRNGDLEKKQRKFDLEMSKVVEQLKSEKSNREKVQREKDELSSQKYAVEQELKNLMLDVEMQTEKVRRLEGEMVELSNAEKGDKEILKLRQKKNELERKVQDQEEELDEQAGTIQQLEQGKLRLEMAQEKLRQQQAKELEDREQELEDLRASWLKKLKATELQLEEEHDENQKNLKEKRELERKIEMMGEQKPVRDKDVEHMLRRDLKRTKALLQDAQLMLQKYKDGAGNRSTIKQLRSQLEDAEFAAAAAVKSRKGVEMELQDVHQQLDDLLKSKQEAEERCQGLGREKNELQSRLEENEEEMEELMKKYKAAVQQHSVDLITFQSQSKQIESLQQEKSSLKEEMAMLQSRTEYFQASTVDRETITRLEAKNRDIEAKLDFEQSTRHRAEVQLGRLKEQLDSEADEKQALRTDENKNQELNKRLQRQVRDLEEELSEIRRKESEAIQRKNDLEKKVEALEGDYDQSQNDLQLAFKRIADLQAVIEDDVDGYDNESDDLEDSDLAPGYGTDSDDEEPAAVVGH